MKKLQLKFALALLLFFLSSCSLRKDIVLIEAQAVVDGWTVSTSGTSWTVQNAFRYDSLPTSSTPDLSKTYHSLKSLQISYPGQTPSVAGQYASLSKMFNANSVLLTSVTPAQYFLNLWVKDTYLGTTSGYHKVEVLVGNVVVWSDDVAGSIPANDEWQQVRVDISTKVPTSKQVNIALRLREQVGVANFGVNVYWDNISISFDEPTNRLVRQSQIRGTLATYGGMGLDRFDGASDTADIQELITEVNYSESNTYNFLLWYENSTANKGRRWKIFREQILSELKSAGKKAWITLVPPTENQSCGKTFNSEPYESDYKLWAQEIAGLSLDYENLTAFAIDDFDNNLPSTNTCLPDYSVSDVANMMNSAHTVSPFLAFVPVVYHNYSNNFIVGSSLRFQNYSSYIDGLQFAYILDTVGSGNTARSLWRTVTIYDQIQEVKGVIGNNTPLIIFDYATGFSSGDVSTPEYVLEVAQKALDYADGLDVYQLQKQSDTGDNRTQEKRESIRQMFSQNFGQGNLNQRQRVYVLSTSDGKIKKDGTTKNYLYSPYWLDATGDQQFTNHQYDLAGDFDGNGLDEIAVFMTIQEPLPALLKGSLFIDQKQQTGFLLIH